MTNAARILDRAGVTYEMATYEVDESDLSATTAADKLGIPVEQVFKTLVASTDQKEIVLACIPADEELDLKSLGNRAGGKKAELVPIADLQKLTGYVRGGCSPLGTRKPYRLFIDETVILHDTISISAGQRGVQLLVNPEDLIEVTEATVLPLVRE